MSSSRFFIARTTSEAHPTQQEAQRAQPPGATVNRPALTQAEPAPPEQPRQRDPEPPRNIRARIDASVRTPGDYQNLSPLAAVEKFITTHTESLHEGIATFLLSRGKEYIVLYHRLALK